MVESTSSPCSGNKSQGGMSHEQALLTPTNHQTGAPGSPWEGSPGLPSREAGLRHGGPPTGFHFEARSSPSWWAMPGVWKTVAPSDFRVEPRPGHTDRGDRSLCPWVTHSGLLRGNRRRSRRSWAIATPGRRGRLCAYFPRECDSCQVEAKTPSLQEEGQDPGGMLGPLWPVSVPGPPVSTEEGGALR